MPYVFDFDHAHPRPPMELKDLLGGKGANLAEMTSVLKLPVPPGFTISTDACRDYMAGGWPKRLDAEVAGARTRLEAAMGKVIGDAKDGIVHLRFVRDEGDITIECSLQPDEHAQAPTGEPDEPDELSIRIIEALVDEHGFDLASGRSQAWIRKRGSRVAS